MKIDDWKRRVAELIALGGRVLRTEDDSFVEDGLFAEFRTSMLSFLLSAFGATHPYYTDCHANVSFSRASDTRQGLGALKAVQKELDGGWIHTTKGLVSAEIFTDFLEMAEHLLSEQYKDAAAVMVGGVLEEHLRQLSAKAGIDVFSTKDGKQVPKKADLLNAELAKASVYGKIDHKMVTAWLGIRNDAAHGHHDQYTSEQVKNMAMGVTEFIARVSV